MSGDIGQTDGQIKRVLSTFRSSFVLVGLFSCLINVLMLGGPLYMLQIYDRVLTSRSVPTLVALSCLIAALYAAMGIFDFVRSRLLVRIGTRLERDMGASTFDALMWHALRSPTIKTDQPVRDLSALRQFLTSQGPFALFDAPWAPVYLAVIFMLHWILGTVALVGMLAIAILAVFNQIATRAAQERAGRTQIRCNTLAATSIRNTEVAHAMGMLPAIRDRWLALKQGDLSSQLLASDRTGAFSVSSKTLRLFLQSAILGVGAALAIENIVSAGVMIAASILLGRALQPLEQLVGNWRNFQTARSAYDRLNDLLEFVPETKNRIELPAFRGQLDVENVSGGPPGAKRPFLQNISFSLKPGDALGLIGPSASGKSTLGRLLVGVWPASEGTARIDGADIAQISPATAHAEVGYLPQSVELFDGTVAENIARFVKDAQDDQVVKAAQMAGCHDLILRLPDGYETEIGESGCFLSAGQRQRVGLARALYNDPSLIVLDEPNANLDSDGDGALNSAIRQLKRNRQTLVIISHRPSAISEVDHILTLDNGKVAAFGPKKNVLEKVLANKTQNLRRPSNLEQSP